MATRSETKNTLLCDLCNKDESLVGFIQQYRMIPTRRYRGVEFEPKGARDVDLCAVCVQLLSREHINLTEPAPKRCGAKKEGERCILERGHKSEHLTVAADHWGWIVVAA